MRVNVSLAAFMLASLAPAPAAAQGDDAREVLAYHLTMPKLQQLNQALADLQRQRETDPAYQQVLKKKQELEALAQKDDPSEAEQERMARLEEEIRDAEEGEDAPEGVEDQSLSDLTKRMAADPRIAGALKRAGLAPREAAVMQLALFQAAFAAAALEEGTVKAISKEVNAENVKFYQVHKAEISALKALGEREERD